MIYEVTHKTTYAYEEEATYAQCVLRLHPMVLSDQKVHAFSLDISPRPARMEDRRGEFGERISYLLIDRPHRRLSITARSLVEVSRSPRLSLFRGRTLADFRAEGFSGATLGPESPAVYLYPTAQTPLADPITDYARESFAPNRPVFDAAFELAQRIHRDFAYDAKATDISTRPLDAFEKRRGVCQDFANIMICGLRGLGLPAAYVAGYLRTEPPPGKPRLQGVDATHAWVGVWCGAEVGWVGIDPTNAVVCQNDHIVLASGRDYGDVAPIEGVILATGRQTIEVAVDVAPVEEEAAVRRRLPGA